MSTAGHYATAGLTSPGFNWYLHRSAPAFYIYKIIEPSFRNNNNQVKYVDYKQNKLKDNILYWQDFQI